MKNIRGWTNEGHFSGFFEKKFGRNFVSKKVKASKREVYSKIFCEKLNRTSIQQKQICSGQERKCGKLQKKVKIVISI